MNKLLSLSIALLSLNLYGAEKAIFSPHGLEGWGKEKGVIIFIEDYSKLDKTFDKKAIKNQVELKLRLAGIKVTDLPVNEVGKVPEDWISIQMMPAILGGRLTGYSIYISPKRTMTFKYNGKQYKAVGSSRVLYGGSTGINYRPELDKHLDQLLINYLKANPKPKEKKSLIEP